MSKCHVFTAASAVDVESYEPRPETQVRVFVSHAWEDKQTAVELARLPPFIHAWVDVRELRKGQDLDPAIIEAIEDSHVFLTMVSRISMTKLYVCKELAWALEHEAKKDRIFVLPVMIEPGIDLRAAASEVFRRLEARLYISSHDSTEAGLELGRLAIANALFHWASDWVERLEPRGDHDRRFVDALENQLVEYRTRLFAVKAALAWPLPVLAQPEALAHLIREKDRYNEFTEAFVPSLSSLDNEIRWRFGISAQRGFKRLRDFVVDTVYQGAAFALNDVIESLNAWDPLLANDPSALAKAESRRELRIASLTPVMAELVERSTDFILTLKS